MIVVTVGASRAEVEALNGASADHPFFLRCDGDQVTPEMEITPFDAVYVSILTHDLTERLYRLVTAVGMARGRPFVASLSRNEEVGLRSALLHANAMLLDDGGRPELVVAACRALLRRSHGSASNEICFGELVGDMAGRQFRFREAVMTLPSIEAGILALLMLKANEPIDIRDLAVRCSLRGESVRLLAVEAKIASICRKLRDLHRQAPTISICSDGSVCLVHRGVAVDHAAVAVMPASPLWGRR